MAGGCLGLRSFGYLGVGGDEGWIGHLVILGLGVCGLDLELVGRDWRWWCGLGVVSGFGMQ